MEAVSVKIEKVTIPTYEVGEYDKNPMFLEKRVYQGSSGRVYPHPVCESVADEKHDKEYTAIFLENKYILVMLLPEIGGRVQRLFDKTNGRDAVYYNEVVKPALVGLAGPWISGGIEFNWPQHHRPSTFDPVDYTIERGEGGSVTVCMGEIEKMFHLFGSASFTVYPDKAYLEIKGRTYNPTDRVQTFLWWANPAVAVNDYTQSIFPPDVHAVMDHGKRDVSTFPIATGTYYKMDYSKGVDISRYKNIPVPTSYMAYHSDYDFIGHYDYGTDSGLLHVADHHVSPGKKQWTWGCGDFGKAWDRNLTDENGPYIELMTGVFTDNQPDFTFLKPYEEKSFVQYFMPYKGIGAIKNASTECAVNLECSGGKVCCMAYAPCVIDNAKIVLVYDGKTIISDKVNLSPEKAYKTEITLDVEDETKLELRVEKNGKTIISYIPEGENKEPVPSPAEAALSPEDIETTEKLFLTAVHLEQYRHATYSPEPYYVEGLRRDPSDIRLNNGYGKYLYNKGLYPKSEEYFRKAVKSSTWKTPNPYDCEPYYNLGLALLAQNDRDGAYDAFAKAAWDEAMKAKSYYKMACIHTSKGEYENALDLVKKSLEYNAKNEKAICLKTSLLRKMGKYKKAEKSAKKLLKLNALSHGGVYELYRLGRRSEEDVHALLRRDAHSYAELAYAYIEYGLVKDACDVLGIAPENDPMINYIRYFATKNNDYLVKAEKASSYCCFPNRLDDIFVLRFAVENGGTRAAYYLGNLLYDKGRWEEAKQLWEGCAEEADIPTVYRNLSLVYYNKLSNPEKAREMMEKAFELDSTDARVFMELDRLYALMNYEPSDRLALMEKHIDLVQKRDDLYTEYVTLLNINGDFEKAYNCIMSRKFHPWEGGEGKITAQYRISLMGMGGADNLEKALEYPYNLGEGKLAGSTDNDIYYMLGKAYEGVDEEKSKEMYTKATNGNFVMSSAMYYNDQPPEMAYYAALAYRALGEEGKASDIFASLKKYGEEHINDDMRIDYFAVSLPDFLIFDADLNKKNKVHCCFMKALGYSGEGDGEKSKQAAAEGLSIDKGHIGLNFFTK